MKLSPAEEDRLHELEQKQNNTPLEDSELQVLLDKYYDQHFPAPAAMKAAEQLTNKKGK